MPLVFAAFPSEKPKYSSQSVENQMHWGEPLNDIRMRLTSPQGNIYKRDISLPLILEVRNVGRQPVPLQKLNGMLTLKVTDINNNIIVVGDLCGHIKPWEFNEGYLPPGKTIIDTYYLERLKFHTQQPLTSINLQFALLTNKIIPGSPPVQQYQYSNAVTIRLEDLPFEHSLTSKDLPEKWTDDIDITYGESGGMFPNYFGIHIDGKGRVTTVSSWPHKGPPIMKGRHQCVLDNNDLDNFLHQLREFNIDKLKACDDKERGADLMYSCLSIAVGGKVFAGQYVLAGSQNRPALTFSGIIWHLTTKLRPEKFTIR